MDSFFCLQQFEAGNMKNLVLKIIRYGFIFDQLSILYNCLSKVLFSNFSFLNSNVNRLDNIVLINIVWVTTKLKHIEISWFEIKKYNISSLVQCSLDLSSVHLTYPVFTWLVQCSLDLSSVHLTCPVFTWLFSLRYKTTLNSKKWIIVSSSLY